MIKRGDGEAGCGVGDGYLELMAAVVEQQVEDADDAKFPKRPKCPKGGAGERGYMKRYGGYKKRYAEVRRMCTEARRYIFNDEPESENYIFGFKFALNYMKIDPGRARSRRRWTIWSLSPG